MRAEIHKFSSSPGFYAGMLAALLLLFLSYGLAYFTAATASAGISAITDAVQSGHFKENAASAPGPSYAEAAQPSPAPARITVTMQPPWRTVRPGLEIMEVALAKQAGLSGSITMGLPAAGARPELIVVRSDPNVCSYSLFMASEDGRSLSVKERLIRHELDSAINAGMYLPDNLTNTGFMRNAGHVNNSRIVSGFGSFFVAGPRKPGLPMARLLERSELGGGLEQILSDYDIVVQNYRLIARNGAVLWPESPAEHSISALAEDEYGNILFILCRKPLSVPDFSRSLQALPLLLSTAMYLEGGVQSGLAMLDRRGGAQFPTAWSGMHNGFMGFSSVEGVALPNIIGVKARN